MNNIEKLSEYIGGISFDIKKLVDTLSKIDNKLDYILKIVDLKDILNDIKDKLDYLLKTPDYRVIGVEKEKELRPGDLGDIHLYVKQLQYLAFTEFWNNFLHSIYDITTEIIKTPVGFLTTEVEPSSSFVFEVDLTNNEKFENKCCLSPIRKSAASLGAHVTLTIKVNEPPVNVRREWQNKYVAIEEPQSVELRVGRMCICPKKKLKIIFKNNHSKEVAYCSFYMESMIVDYNKANKLVGTVYYNLARDFLREMGFKV